MLQLENSKFSQLMSESVVSRRAVGLSAVVPCYNEEAVIPELLRRLSIACRDCVGSDYEIVLVNDGSSDRTWSLIKSSIDVDQNVVGVNLARNYGHQLALTAGLSVCQGERILVIDADLQDPPELLNDMWALMDEGFDVVYGQRRSRAGETFFKKASAALFYRFLRKIIDVEIPLDSGDFRIMSRRVLETLQSMPEHYRFIRGMVTWIGLKQIPLLYDRAERFAGDTKYPLKKMIYFALDAVTGFSTRPLRLAIHAGFMLVVLAMLMIGYTLYGWFTHDVVAGWASVMCVVLVLGSANMLFLGIIGEYLGRLYMEAKRRPLFVINEIASRQVVPEYAGNTQRRELVE